MKHWQLNHQKVIIAYLFRALAVLVFVIFLIWWERYASRDSPLVAYFDRPSVALRYFQSEWGGVVVSSLACLITALGSLAIATLIAVGLLVLGMRSDGRLAKIERVAAVVQTVPTLIVVTIFLLVERQLLHDMHAQAAIDVYCLAPVAFALSIAPLVTGVGAINRAPIDMKRLMRLWDATPGWRVHNVYLPFVFADILTGARASATWAVSAVLVAEGMMNGVEGDRATLGHSLIKPFSGNEKGETVVVIIASTVVGFACYWIACHIQKRLERWIYGTTAVDHNSYPLQSVRMLAKEDTDAAAV
jgi:ABC-type nitrate/sulfonate/bicarbonate transport system permease component